MYNYTEETITIKGANISGGYFEYKQYHIQDIIEKLKETKVKVESDEEYYEFDRKQELLEEISNGLDYLNLAEIYTQRLDWLFSGDDGEDSFFERLEEELEGFWESELGENK